MATERVRKREDEWVEVPAEAADGSGYVVEPIQLRAGADDDSVRIANVPGNGAEIKIADLRFGLKVLEQGTV